MNEDSFSFSFAAQKELLRERILADARAARELLHSQVDQVLLVAFDQVSSSAQVATNAYKLAQVQNPPKDPPKDSEEKDGSGGRNLILQNMLTQLETLRGGRKSVNSCGYGRSSLGSSFSSSSSKAEPPLSLEMIVPLFSYFVGHQPQPALPPIPQQPQQKSIKERKSADSKLSAAAAAAKKCSPVNKGSSFAASSSLSSSSRSFGESSASATSASLASTTTTKALGRKRNNNKLNNLSMDNKSIIINSSIVDEKPLEWSPSSSGYSSTEEDLLIRSSTSINNNSHNNSHLPLDLSIKSVRKSWQQPQQPNKFPLKVIAPKIKIKKEEEADSFTPLTMMDLIKNSSSSSSSKPTAFVLPIKKRKYAEMDSTTTAVVAVKAEPATTSPKAIVFQDELINNFAQANRKENMLTVGRKCLIEDCPMFFPADKRAMHAHMAADHGVLQFACQVVGCTASFDAQ